MTPPILALAHGVHLDFPETLYHERVIGMASKSLLDRLHISPAHLRAYVDGDAVDDGSSCDDEESEPAAPADESKALRFGRALHTAILEPERFARAYTVAPVFGDLRATDRTSKEDAKANKIRRDEWRAANAGREILTAADSARIGGMASALRKFQPLAGRVIDKGAHEVTLRWRDAETGIESRARLDVWHEASGTVLDLKSTLDAGADSFARSIDRFRYDVQEAMYRDALDVLGLDVRRFLFLAQEKSPPYACALYELERESVALGRAELRVDFELYARCLETDTWPAYPQGVTRISLPRFTKRGSSR